VTKQLKSAMGPPPTAHATPPCRMAHHAVEGKHGSIDLGHDGPGEDLEMKGGGVKCAKEKNRQAQRRFRERQKCLIQTLKDREEGLRKQVLSSLWWQYDAGAGRSLGYNVRSQNWTRTRESFALVQCV